MAIPPGETMAAELTARGQTTEDLAADCGVDLASAMALVRGELSITSEVAAKLGAFFGSSPAFWLKLEAQYREALDAGKAVEPIPPHGGNIALRVPKSLHQRIRRLAALEGVSMNHCLLAIVAEGVARQELQHPGNRS